MAIAPLARAGSDAGLGTAGRRFARYLIDAAHRTAGDWSAYYAPRSEAGNFGTRFQLAFHGYAIAALGERLPAFRKRTADALAAIINRMLDPFVWTYWLQRGETLDPIGPHNIMYSGHLGQLIGHYERFADDGRYDQPFVLDDGARSRHEHSHASIVRSIVDQMATNRCHGVTCEPGFIYVACNDHAALSALLYDAAHGTSLSGPVADWLTWLRARMVRRRGSVFQVAYLTGPDVVLPFNFQVMDVWSLAFLSPVAPELFETLYRRWRRTAKRVHGLAWAPARWPNEPLEIADEALNTGFAYVAAREAGDSQLADRFMRYAEERLGLADEGGGRACWATPRRLMVTALFALGAALEPGDMRRWVQPRPAGFFQRPRVLSVTGGEVSRAEWDERGALVVDMLPEAADVVLTCAGVSSGAPDVAGGVVLRLEKAATGWRVALRLAGPARITWAREAA